MFLTKIWQSSTCTKPVSRGEAVLKKVEERNGRLHWRNVIDNRPLLSFDSDSSRSTSSTNSFISEIDHWDSDLDIENSQPDVAYFASSGDKVG